MLVLVLVLVLVLLFLIRACESCICFTCAYAVSYSTHHSIHSPLNLNPYPLLVYCSRYNGTRHIHAPSLGLSRLSRLSRLPWNKWVQSQTHFLLSDRNNCFPIHVPVIWPGHQLTPFVSSCPGPCDGELNSPLPTSARKRRQMNVRPDVIDHVKRPCPS